MYLKYFILNRDTLLSTKHFFIPDGIAQRRCQYSLRLFIFPVNFVVVYCRQFCMLKQSSASKSKGTNIK